MYNPKMKAKLKEIAAQIRNGKSGRKPENRTDDNKDDLRHLYQNQYKFRHMHIASCLMRGRTMEQIEVPGEFHQPSQAQIDHYLKVYHVEPHVEEEYIEPMEEMQQVAA